MSLRHVKIIYDNNFNNNNKAKVLCNNFSKVSYILKKQG